MTLPALIRRATIIALPALLAAVATITVADTAHATDYADPCFAHGHELWPWRGGPGTVEVPTTQVSYGSSGDCVAYAQWLLELNGHPEVAVDRSFGPITRAAVDAYQTQMQGLGYCGGADGTVGPRTFMCLETGN
jgi:putative peptidoglycan binding protein